MSDFYLCASAKSAVGGGIYRYAFESRRPVRKGFTPVDNPTFLVSAPDGRVLYASCIAGGRGSVAAFDVNEWGELALSGTLPSDGATSCYLGLAPDAKFLYAANYRAGSFTEFRLDGAGHLAERVRAIRHDDREKGPVAARQEQAHPHCTVFTPDGRYLAVCDLGCDRVKFYRYRSGAGIELPACGEFVAAPGEGPRHLIFDRTGEIAYLINEVGNTVLSLAYAEGALRLIERVSTLPPDFAGATKAAALRFSPDGRYLLATNRGHDSTAVFALDGRGGMKLRELVPSMGASPRDAAFLPEPGKFATANEGGTVAFFDWRGDTGELAPDGGAVYLPTPLYIYTPPRR